MPTRRLAAILAADVVGYSRLVSADETDALARLSTLRSNIIEPGIAKHSGRLFKVMGDGFLVEFASARAIDLDPMCVGGYIGLSAVLSRAKGTQAKAGPRKPRRRWKRQLRFRLPRSTSRSVNARPGFGRRRSTPTCSTASERPDGRAENSGPGRAVAEALPIG
jgi:class 3 adenylate cyclase